MTLLKTVIKAVDDLKAVDIEILDMRKNSPLMDYMVICTGRSDRQVGAIVKKVKEELQKNNYPVKNIEGANGNMWVLVDCFDIVVHVFLSEERSKYGLERLWGDVPRIPVNNNL